MLLLWCLGGLAVLAFVIQLWQVAAAVHFPLHRHTDNPDFHPALSVLKPLKGVDEHTRACLESWLSQEYPGSCQILLGVHEESDPVVALVHELLAAHPKAQARLVVCPERPGTNAKVGTLSQLEDDAAHDVILISDADVLIPPGFLIDVVSPLRDPDVALVNCFYRLANPATAALRWEAVAVNADFWSQVLQSRTLKPLDFALGAVIATRRRELQGIGGFRSLVDHLADDYQLGRRIHQRGGRIEITTIPVECWDPPAGWSVVWRHQLRWNRTIRVCQPLPYFASILGNGSVWAAAWLLSAVHAGASPWPAVGLLLARAAFAEFLYRRFCRGRGGHAEPWYVWLRDVMGLALWASAFLGDTVVWRGTRFRVLRDGRLVPVA